MDIKGICTVSLIAIVIVFSSVMTSHSATSKVRIFVYNPGYANIDTKIERVEASIKSFENLNVLNDSGTMQRVADYSCTINQVCRVMIGNKDLSRLSSDKIEEEGKIVKFQDREIIGKGLKQKSDIYIAYKDKNHDLASDSDIYITIMP